MNLSQKKTCTGCRALKKEGEGHICTLGYATRYFQAFKKKGGIPYGSRIPLEPCYKPMYWLDYDKCPKRGEGEEAPALKSDPSGMGKKRTCGVCKARTRGKPYPSCTLGYSTSNVSQRLGKQKLIPLEPCPKPETMTTLRNTPHKKEV